MANQKDENTYMQAVKDRVAYLADKAATEAVKFTLGGGAVASAAEKMTPEKRLCEVEAATNGEAAKCETGRDFASRIKAQMANPEQNRSEERERMR